MPLLDYGRTFLDFPHFTDYHRPDELARPWRNSPYRMV